MQKKHRKWKPPFSPRDYFRELLAFVIIVLVACLGHLLHNLRTAQHNMTATALHQPQPHTPSHELQ